jgi:hypothetical protein
MKRYRAVFKDVTEIPKLGNDVVGGSTHKQRLYILLNLNFRTTAYGRIRRLGEGGWKPRLQRH